jgi:hypothetical protein
LQVWQKIGPGQQGVPTDAVTVNGIISDQNLINVDVRGRRGSLTISTGESFVAYAASMQTIPLIIAVNLFARAWRSLAMAGK